MENVVNTTEYSNITSENISDDDILIIPPQGKRRGRIIIEASYKKNETSEDIRRRNEIILNIMLKYGLKEEIEKVNNED